MDAETQGAPGTDSLVERGVRRWGRLPRRPTVVDPLAAYSGLERRWRWLRLKEWVGWTLVHPDVHASLVLQDAHYLASSEIYVRDRATGRLHQHARTARGGTLGLRSTLWGSHPALAARGYRVGYDLGPADGVHRLAVDIAATDAAPALSGVLELDGAAASPPLSVSSRLPGGAMYTHKAVFPASGTLRVGGREVVFDPARDLAILDEHKSFLPYRTSWLWGTFAARRSDGIVGANLVERPELPGEPQESCVWLPGAVEPLSDVAFSSSTADRRADGLWRMRTPDGRVDVTFAPDGRKDVRHQLGLFAIDYFQLYGRYTGTVRGADGTAYEVDVHGVCESMRARL